MIYLNGILIVLIFIVKVISILIKGSHKTFMEILMTDCSAPHPVRGVVLVLQHLSFESSNTLAQDLQWRWRRTCGDCRSLSQKTKRPFHTSSQGLKSVSDTPSGGLLIFFLYIIWLCYILFYYIILFHFILCDIIYYILYYINIHIDNSSQGPTLDSAARCASGLHLHSERFSQQTAFACYETGNGAAVGVPSKLVKFVLIYSEIH